MKQVTLAKTAGFCFGVSRAVNLAFAAAQEANGKQTATLGPIIHNRHVIEKLADLGVREIQRPEEAPVGSRVILRSHGTGPDTLEALNARGVEILDATCPDVKKIHKIVQKASGEGRQVIIMGKVDHPEVIAAASWGENTLVFAEPQELENWILTGERRHLPITVLFQTTARAENLEITEEILKKWCTSAEISDTICNATSLRQEEARALSKKCDVMLVIGDKDSANSRNLAAICEEHCKNVVFFEEMSALFPEKFKQKKQIGIIAGASTPAWIIKEVFDTMNEEMLRENETTQPEPEQGEETMVVENPVAAAGNTEPEEESFEAMLEKSIKTLHTGARVVGIVTNITPTEISVDLGTKQAAYIPMAELTDDPDEKVEDLVQVGGEVEAYVMRVNDVEGMVTLSKKRLDTVKFWDQIDTAMKNKTVLEGKVKEENKGGVVVFVKGIRVFVPASQSGLPKDQPMTGLLNQTVRLRITEVNQSRRRVVGSIRMVGSEERREQAEKVWAEIENGKRYTGTVKSLTTYGAFVDIGGVDGMVHVSELSWKRISNPAQVVKVGDSLEVFVLSFDKEKGKISLGHKDPNQNPWKNFTDKYAEGSVAPVRIIKLMPFGAFAEIVPGVDGLIHISQIADRRIGRPDEFLSEGQEVDAKVIAIDYEKKNVSLSIRALTETAKGAPEADFVSEAGEEDGQDAVVYDTDVNQPDPEAEQEVAAE